MKPMPPKKKESGLQRLGGIFDAVKGALAIVPQMFLPAIFGRIHQEIDTILDNVEERMLRIQEQMISRIIARLSVAFLAGIGILFMFLAGFFALREYLKLNFTLCFLIVGIAMLALALGVRHRTTRNESTK